MLGGAGLLEVPGIQVVDPLGYLDFLSLVRGAALVVTDSGGIQEETTVLRIPCLTLRPNTERPVTISHGKPGYETPVGTFSVLRKVKNDWSVPYNGPMPNAVYFTTTGIAFHQGDTAVQSHGCIRMPMDASLVFYDNLMIGEQVQVLP